MARDLRDAPAVEDLGGAGGVPVRQWPRPAHRPPVRPAPRPATGRVPPASDFGAAATRGDDHWDDEWDERGRFADHPHL